MLFDNYYLFIRTKNKSTMVMNKLIPCLLQTAELMLKAVENGRFVIFTYALTFFSIVLYQDSMK